MSSEKLQAVYAATTIEQQEAAYDNWAREYERDLHVQGYTLPSLCAVLFAAFVEERNGPFLDAGCGTGMQLDPLYAAGFRGFTGLDLSAGMLALTSATLTWTDCFPNSSELPAMPPPRT